MCHDPSASPPAPPRRGELATSDRLTVASSGGLTVAARLAATQRPDAPGVVVMPDVRGLHPFYERFAEALADTGAHALAIDPYTRTAGSGFRDESFEFMPHREVVTDEGLREDARAAATVLRDRGVEQVYALGFCFGGRAALLQAVDPDWAGVIGFYGRLRLEGESGLSPIGVAEAGRVRVPTLALFGEADPWIPPDDVEAFRAGLAAHGIPHEIVAYDGAPHSFFDRDMAAHADSCADAWSRLLSFLGIA
jgi:carboxymethylenebutenolidase